eukprot:scaffold1092_cov19-Tisochrysis_lutea.AAC.4
MEPAAVVHDHFTKQSIDHFTTQVIMLVESVDGTKALLGRSHRSPAGMYTTLSGFLDQCESIEE